MATTSHLKPGNIQVSVVIPVHNDTDAVRRLLPQLLEQSNIAQVIICASVLDDALSELATDPVVTLTSTDANRGNQLNHGATLATQNALWFVHADATVSPDAAQYIQQRIHHGDVGGWFQFAFANMNTTATQRLASLINWRARHGIAYGDQGLFFVRDAFHELGGFAAAPLFEEVALVRAAKRTGRFRESHLAIGVNPRRWQRAGWTRRTLSNRALALAHAAGVSPDTLARWYQRAPRTGD